MVRGAIRLALMMGLIVLSGCGKKGTATYQVTGTVTIDGKPAEGARVIFCPQQGVDPEAARLRPLGVTDSSGQFVLTTYVKGDGAPPGNYNLIVTWPEPPRPRPEGGGGRTSRGKDRLKGKYGSPDKSGLVATVEQGATTVPPIELKTR